MTVIDIYKFDGFEGDPIKVELKGSPKGLRFRGPGSFIEDRLILYGKTGRIRAEREIGGYNKEKVKIVIEKTLRKEEVKELINVITDPLRKPQLVDSVAYTETMIWNSEGKEFTVNSGDIDEALKTLNIDLDRPFPNGPEIKVDKTWGP